MRKILLFCLLVSSVFSYIPINTVYYIGAGVNTKTSQMGLAPIFDFTYHMNNTITLPNNLTYTYPDQIVVSPYDMVHEIVFDSNCSYYQEFLDSYLSWFSFDIDLGVKLFSLAFQYNKELGFVYDSLNEGYIAVMSGYHYWVYYSATLYPAYVLPYNDMFNVSVAALPETINTQQDYEKYDAFVTSFGTHYMDHTLMGARVSYLSAITEQICEKYQASFLIEQFSFTFYSKLFNISSGGFKNISQINISDIFVQNSNGNATFWGGDAAYASIFNLSTWVNSIEQNTMPLNSSLAGIWSLIGNTTKSSTFYSFVKSYLNNDTFQDYMLKNNPKGLLKYFKDSHQSFPGQYCIGAGVDTTSLDSCLLPLLLFEYDNNTQSEWPTNVFVQWTPESQLINVNVTMTETFDCQAYTDLFYSSNYGLFDMGTKTTQVYEFYSEYYTNSKSLSANYLTISYLTLTMPLLPLPKINPLFTQYVDFLPPYDSTNQTVQEYYFLLFQSFGTAVADVITLGGKFSFDLWYDNQFCKTYSYEQIVESAHWSFIGICGSGYGHSQTIQNVSSEFINKMEFDYSYLGGNITYSYNDWAYWLESVKGDMAVIQYHLQPITLLVQDEAKQADILLAFNDYAQDSINDLNAYIESLQNGKKINKF